MSNIAFKHPIQKSLRRKLLLPLIFVGIIFTAGVIFFAQIRFQQLLVEKLAVRAELLANTVNYAAEGLSRAGELQRIVTALGAERDVNLILVIVGTEPARIVAANKTTFLSKTLDKVISQDKDVENHVQDTLQNKKKITHLDNTQNTYEIAIPLLISQQTMLNENTLMNAVVFVQLASKPTKSDALQTIGQFTALFLGIFLILILCSLGLLRHYVICPIKEIIRHISDGQAIQIKKYNDKNYDEIGWLNDTISDALNRTELAYKTLKEQQKERDLLLKILEDAPDFVGMSDVQANLKYLNPAAKRMVGLPDDTDISKLKINDMHPEWAANLVLNEGIPEILKNGFWKSEHAVLNSVTHTEIPVSQILILHHDEHGEPKLISTIMRDITERKQNEQRLLESEFRWKFAIDGAGDGLWDWNITNHTVFFSKQYKEMYGFEEYEISDDENEWVNRIHPDDKEHTFSVVQTYLHGESPSYVNENRMMCKDGSYKWIMARGMIVERDDEGKPLRMIGTHTDVTKRKVMEAELKRSNADLEQFAYAVSHDMRQPLRMVTNYLDLIEKALQSQLDEDTQQFLKFAADGAKRMDAMILSLLDYSRLGKNSEALTVISTRAAIDEALLFLKVELETSGGKVEILGDWIDLIASHDELTRLFQNLIGNALKYHDEDKPPVVWVSATVTANIFRVEVFDNGIGINPNQIDRLFKVFSRLQARNRFEGTGVGLALCRKIVEHHDGKIGVKSAGEGLGCTFWFELPRKSIQG